MPLAVDELAEAGWCPLQGVALRVADLVIGRHADAADELPGGQRKSTWGREVTALVLLVAKVGASRHCETPIWRRRYETRRPALTAAGILFTASRLIALGYETCHFGRFPVMGLGAPRRKTDRTRHCSGWSCGPQPGPGRTPPSQNPASGAGKPVEHQWFSRQSAGEVLQWRLPDSSASRTAPGNMHRRPQLVDEVTPFTTNRPTERTTGAARCGRSHRRHGAGPRGAGCCC